MTNDVVAMQQELDNLVSRISRSDEMAFLDGLNSSPALTSRYRALTSARLLWCRLQSTQIPSELFSSDQSDQGLQETIQWDDQLFPAENIQERGFDLRRWALYVVRSSSPRPRRVLHSVAVPFVNFAEGDFVVCDLRLDLHENGDGAILPTKEQYTIGLAKAGFNNGLSKAMAIAKDLSGISNCDVIWKLINRDDGGLYSRPLESLVPSGAALYGLLRLLARQNPDEGLLVLASLESDGQLRECGRAKERVSQWCQYLETVARGKGEARPRRLDFNTLVLGGNSVAPHQILPDRWLGRISVETAATAQELDATRSIVIKKLLRGLAASDPETRRLWGAIVDKVDTHGGIKPLLIELVSSIPSIGATVKVAIIEALGELGDPAAISEVIKGLTGLSHDPDWRVRSEIAHTIGKIGPRARTAEIMEALNELSQDSNEIVRSYCSVAIAVMTGQQSNM